MNSPTYIKWLKENIGAGATQETLLPDTDNSAAPSFLDWNSEGDLELASGGLCESRELGPDEVLDVLNFAHMNASNGGTSFSLRSGDYANQKNTYIAYKKLFNGVLDDDWTQLALKHKIGSLSFIEIPETNGNHYIIYKLINSGTLVYSNEEIFEVEYDDSYSSHSDLDIQLVNWFNETVTVPILYSNRTSGVIIDCNEDLSEDYTEDLIIGNHHIDDILGDGAENTPDEKVMLINCNITL